MTTFGSVRTRPGVYAHDKVKGVATALAGMGCDIIAGDGPGLLQTANERAESATWNS